LSLAPCLLLQHLAQIYEWPFFLLLGSAGAAGFASWAFFSSFISPLVYEELTTLVSSVSDKAWKTFNKLRRNP